MAFTVAKTEDCEWILTHASLARSGGSSMPSAVVLVAIDHGPCCSTMMSVMNKDFAWMACSRELQCWVRNRASSS